MPVIGNRSIFARTLLRACGVLTCTLLGVASVHACTSRQQDGSASLVIDAWDDTTPDMLISAWSLAGAANFLFGCSPSEVIPIDIRSAMPTLAFVRMVVIKGENYPAFELTGHARSPLLIFQYLTGNGLGAIAMPLDPRIVQHNPGKESTAADHRWSAVRVAAVSRGGDMQSVPTTSVGDVTHMSPLYPSFVKREAFSVTANLRTKTCTINAATVALQNVSAADLPAADRTAGTRDFNVVMNCNGQFPVTMKLTDANAAGNTGSRLTPTSNATAGSVRVQLLREGTPVVLGQTWSIAQSQTGNQDIALSARYYREAGTFHSGAVEGQAVIEATYR